MDAVDSVFYQDVTAPENLINAYSFFNTEEGKLVLKDLQPFLGWGAQDPTIMGEEDAKSILAMQRVVWRIKAMLNAKPQTETGEDDE